MTLQKFNNCYLEDRKSDAHKPFVGCVSWSKSLHKRYHTHLIIDALLCYQKLDVVGQKLCLRDIWLQMHSLYVEICGVPHG